MPKIVNTALKAKAKAWTFEAKAKATGPKAKAIKFGLEAPRGQGLASRTTSLLQLNSFVMWAVHENYHSSQEPHFRGFQCVDDHTSWDSLCFATM